MMQGKRWYAIRTKPRAEKKAEEALKVKGIEVYMPVQKTLRQWSDRKKWIWEPVLKSYLFVCVEAREIDLVRFTHGVSGFIVFGGVPASIPEAQIRLLK